MFAVFQSLSGPDAAPFGPILEYAGVTTGRVIPDGKDPLPAVYCLDDLRAMLAYPEVTALISAEERTRLLSEARTAGLLENWREVLRELSAAPLEEDEAWTQRFSIAVAGLGRQALGVVAVQIITRTSGQEVPLVYVIRDAAGALLPLADLTEVGLPVGAAIWILRLVLEAGLPIGRSECDERFLSLLSSNSQELAGFIMEHSRSGPDMRNAGLDMADLFLL